MDNKPSYQVLKAVLARMEANKRLQIMSACPSLRKVDKAVPLTIQHLEFFSDYIVKVNDNIYKFGVVREYRDGNPTETIQVANKKGGLQCDVDEWGFERQSYGCVKTPGDLILKELSEEKEEVYDDDRRRAHEEAIEECKSSYSKDEHETALLPYYCRDTNTKPAHDCFIQLSLTKFHVVNKTEPICKLPYTKKLYEAMKSFMDFIFGGRSHSVQIKRLEIHVGQIIRLPEGIKFYVHELKLTRDLDLISRIIAPVLDEPCMPIKHINTFNLYDKDHPFMKNAEEITFYCPAREPSYIEVFRNLPHLKITFPFDDHQFHYGELISFIKNMLDNNRKRIGTMYQFGIENKEKILGLLVAIKNQCKEKVIQFDNKCLILQMEGSKQMDVSYKKNIETLDSFDFLIFSEYLLKIEIVEQK